MNKIVALPFKNQEKLICRHARQKLLDAGFTVVGNETGHDLSKDELRLMIKDAFAVIAGLEQYSADVLCEAQKLKVVIRFGVGTDNLDLRTMQKMGIKVGSITNCNAVAEYALALMLACYRRIPEHDSLARSCSWVRLPIREISGKCIGIVGFGRVGRRLAQLLSGFDAKILVYDMQLDEQAAKALNVQSVCFDELLAQSDIISLHLPSTPQTFHLINGQTIAKMKDQAVLINTARGSLIDEPALVQALTSGKLLCAGLDVFEQEPITNSNPFLPLKDRTVLSPHAAASTFETNYNGSLTAVDSILSVYNGGDPIYKVV